MRKKVIKISLLCIIIAFVISVTIVCALTMKNETSTLHANSANLKASNATTASAPHYITSSYAPTGSDTSRMITDYTFGSSPNEGIAAGNGLYCIAHGRELLTHGDRLTKEDILPFGSLSDSSVRRYFSHEWCDRLEPGYTGIWDELFNTYGFYFTKERSLMTTYPYLTCIRDHQNLAYSMPEIAYAISSTSQSQSYEVQNAIWASGLNIGPAWTSPNGLYNQGTKYREFHNKITNNNSNISSPNIDAKDTTKEIKVQVDYKEKELILGPFSIDYTNGNFYDSNRISFGGISDMYFIAYNSKQEEIKENNQTKKIKEMTYCEEGEKSDKYKELDFFTPNEKLVDTTKQSYPKGERAGGKPFYLKIKNPNLNLSNENYESKGVAYLKLHIDFKYMCVTNATVCKMQANKWELRYEFERKNPSRTEIHCFYGRFT